MSEYFSNFPKILYDIHGTNSTSPNYTVGTNLLIRQKLKDAVKNDISIVLREQILNLIKYMVILNSLGQYIW